MRSDSVGDVPTAPKQSREDRSDVHQNTIDCCSDDSSSDTSSNRDVRDSELTALDAIYAGETVRVGGSRLRVAVGGLANRHAAVLIAVLPHGYPSRIPPRISVVAPDTEDGLTALPPHATSLVAQAIQTIPFVPGCPVLFDWLAAARQALEDAASHVNNNNIGSMLTSNVSNTNQGTNNTLNSNVNNINHGDNDDDDYSLDEDDSDDDDLASVAHLADDDATKPSASFHDPADDYESYKTRPKHTGNNGNTGNDDPTTYKGLTSSEPLIERKSVFVAHVAPVSSVDDVKRAQTAILSDKRVARATHNIMAYRIVSPDGVIRASCDDDGETAAGGRLLHLLTMANCQNVIVVVSRWYGGVQLGPTRFKCISNVARNELQRTGFIVVPSDTTGSKGRKNKTSRKKR